MSKRSRKHDDGGYQIPCAPMVPDGETQFEQLLGALNTTYEEALSALMMPDTDKAKTLKRRMQLRLRRDNFRFNFFVPEAVFDALGWQKEQEHRFSNEYRGPSKRKRTAKAKQAETVNA